MFELEPEGEKLMAHYRAHIAEYGSIADAFSIPLFSDFCLDELTTLLGRNESSELVQAVARIGNYSDQNEYETRGKAVTRLLRAKGIRLPRGKRTRAGMLKFVAAIVPILLYYGLPCATSERSRLVRALRIIAAEIGLTGDPRDELRRLNKIKKVHARFVKKIVFEATAKGLAPDFVNSA